MSDVKWELNQSYRLVYVKEFLDSDPSNGEIYEVIKDNVFEVTATNDFGHPTEILVSGCPFTIEEFGLLYIFETRDIDYFYLVEDVVSTTTQTANVMPNTQVNHFIAEWLEKLAAVYCGCMDVGCIDFRSDNVPLITTDFGDIVGALQVVDFVNTRYTELKAKEDAKRKSELEEKRLKVLDELSKIDQELGLYNT